MGHTCLPGYPGPSGVIHLDDQQDFTIDPSEGGRYLPEMALHFIGHALGATHSTDSWSVMYPWMSDVLPRPQLGHDDRNQIRALYGFPGSVPPFGPPFGPQGGRMSCIPIPRPRPEDADGDGVLDGVEEYGLGTDPSRCDTDGDELPDREAMWGLNPLKADSDGDGTVDSQEVLRG